MSQTEFESTPIQFEVGRHKTDEILRTGFRHYDGSPVVRESLELASAQLAIALADTGSIDTVPERISAHMAESESRIFMVEELLNNSELDVLPAARMVIGLTFSAARVSLTPKQR